MGYDQYSSSHTWLNYSFSSRPQAHGSHQQLETPVGLPQGQWGSMWFFTCSIDFNRWCACFLREVRFSCLSGRLPIILPLFQGNPNRQQCTYIVYFLARVSWLWSNPTSNGPIIKKEVPLTNLTEGFSIFANFPKPQCYPLHKLHAQKAQVFGLWNEFWMFFYIVIKLPCVKISEGLRYNCE